MAERKVISKYYPPNFDPSKLRPSRKPDKPAALPTITVMAPFSMRCTSCSTYIYKGRKFNARKEKLEETYLGIPIIRLYIRCTECSSEICFKTDPNNTGYVCEKGAVRNYDPWRMMGREDVQESTDVMAAVENKMVDAKTEMAIADTLDEIRTRNARRAMAASRLPAFSANIKVDDQHQASLEDDHAASKAFNSSNERIHRLSNDTSDAGDNAVSSKSVTTFRRSKRQKKDHSAALGIKRKLV
ncbi:MAG: Uncharacterized protein AUREO_062330 [Aureobasidium pullulans]|jgi:hypothetical protein|uniref:Splicing factor YJU2 n=2 Tax=Aureobasidium pullulans TaxID=5580 RepID=A0A1A7MB26_AURPU|nr:MAG: Uncharacterized protein AUREO_062330 [Aureobasidium pullulans]THV72398.1 DUF572-domain-containing protein [Aureobasidium pullulans]THW59699.1 DUF572-domain-containing protein [Aureobasidium pullulans]THW80728.1 DUF572-domain-containing protein [Aureobasidium pullulans]TIA15704.1 DUF572-domain-containing protein [Aureobasidium pullulans]